MKKLNVKQYARLLYQLTEGKSKSELPWLIKGFVGLLARRHQLSLKDRIAAEYDALVQEQTGQYRARIRSAQALPTGTKNNIIASLKTGFGYQVSLEESVDPALIGGFTVQVKDMVIDATVRRQLQSLKARLINS